MKSITTATIEHLIELGRSRELRKISPQETAELFDSIDCLDIEELAELYALLEIGKSERYESFVGLSFKARELGFSLVEVIFEQDRLGSLLSKGYAIFRAKST